MGKLVSTADVCTSVTGPSVAVGLGLNRDVAINDADPGRRVSSTARQEKSISPDPAHHCPTATEQNRGSLCDPLSVFWVHENGLLYKLHADQKSLPPKWQSAVLSLPHRCGQLLRQPTRTRVLHSQTVKQT